MEDSPREGLLFRTPARILIPKLIRSREGWKEKSGERRKCLKAAKIRVRDLEASREQWRQRAEQAERELATLRGELSHGQQALADE